MFEPVGLGDKIFRERYARNEEETWTEACSRVSKHVANAEENGKVNIYAERFYNQLVENKFMPGGRIWYGSGRPYAPLLNCFVLGIPSDSAEGWGEIAKNVIIVSSSMGGIGINFSNMRPRGSILKRKGRSFYGSRQPYAVN